MIDVLGLLAVIVLALVFGFRLLSAAYRFGCHSAQIEADIAAEHRSNDIDAAADSAITADDWETGELR